MNSVTPDKAIIVVTIKGNFCLPKYLSVAISMNTSKVCFSVK